MRIYESFIIMFKNLSYLNKYIMLRLLSVYNVNHNFVNIVQFQMICDG